MNAKDLHVLSYGDVTSRTPALSATGPSPDRSSRYEFVDSLRVVGYLEEAGYRITDARGGKRGASREFGAHTLHMRAPFGKLREGDLYPEIVFTNSHDGSTRAKLDLGIYRVACSNGIVVSNSAGMSFSIPHIGDQKAAVLNAAQSAMDFVPKLGEVVVRWEERLMKVSEVDEFHRRAKELRTGQALAKDLDLLAPLREADARDTLWNVFNRAQESLIKGGREYRTAGGRLARTKPLGAVKKTLDVNQRLWDIAAEFLPA